jgi:hypothetical protein
MDLQKIKNIAAELSSARVDLGIAAGVIPQAPADAYRVGYQQGVAAATQATADAACWFCRHPRQKPSLDDQVRQLASMHYDRSALFHFPPSEFQALRELLEDGDVLAAVVTGAIFYGAVRVIRNGQAIDIPRKELQSRPRMRDAEKED